MNAKRTRLIMFASLGILFVMFIATISVGSSILAQKSKKMVALKLQSSVLDSQLTSLAQAKKDVSQYAYFNEVAETVIPSDKDQAQTVLDIFQLAEQSGIMIQSITFPASTLGTSGASATSSSTKAISQAKSVEGIKGLYSVELNITPLSGAQTPTDKMVTYAKFLDFLGRIESNRRTAQITQVNIQPISNGGDLSQFINFTLTINIFIKP
jgi:hypothetical protein